MKSNYIQSFLSSNPDAVAAFTRDAHSLLNKNQTSNKVKHSVYAKYFDIEPRPKFTGFEKLEELDKIIRAKLSALVTPYEEKEILPVDQSPQVNFKQALIDRALRLKNRKNFLYYSGGVDSEVVLLAFLEAKVDFTPVIFVWENNKMEALNCHDVQYALKFCARHNLHPVIRTLNVERFWNSDEIVEMAHKYNQSSPQLLTYYKMVSTFNDELKGEKNANQSD